MMKHIVIACVAMLTVAGLAYVLYPNQHDEAEGLVSAVMSDGGQRPDMALDTEGLNQIPITGSNTSVGFSCAKTVAGKTLIVRGGWSGKFGSELQGTVGIDPQTHEPVTLSAKVKIDSLWSEHDQLTKALLTAGFFRPDEHPWADFQGVFVRQDGHDMVTGDFELNGITKLIEFPVEVSTIGQTLQLTSAFSLDRKAFDVRLKNTGALGLLLTDEDIADRVAIKLHIYLPLESGKPEIDAQAHADALAAEAQDESQIPTDIPDAFTETIPSTQVQFDMVLVPGDQAHGVAPFYIGKHEVTWDEFMPWVQGKDLADESLVGEERAMKLRPSSPYGTVDRNFGMYRRPALGMSRLSAELYCKWLSDQTGRRYRLPTEAEWEQAYTAGGGNPRSPLTGEEAERFATYKENAWNDSIGDWATTKIGEHEPNTLGVHDMAGNVAEWVTDTGEEHVVRGGHFESPLSELGVGRTVEDMDVWNRDYPNEPKSQWWYVNARWVGFRVVCETP
jgi:formylglycine-generating enzyme required for sulfatase activity/polyisoprenoid-binding protein YceI